MGIADLEDFRWSDARVLFGKHLWVLPSHKVMQGMQITCYTCKAGISVDPCTLLTDDGYLLVWVTVLCAVRAQECLVVTTANLNILVMF